MNMSQASEHTGIGRTLFKQVCRRHGILNWNEWQVHFLYYPSTYSSGAPASGAPASIPLHPGDTTHETQPGIQERKLGKRRRREKSGKSKPPSRAKVRTEMITGMNIGRVVISCGCALCCGYLLHARHRIEV